jgi:3-deoxy-D-manno-octulosonic-acid transferase
MLIPPFDYRCRCMRRIYSFILYLLMPLIILRLYWKSRRLPVYRQRIGERFARYRQSVAPVDVWLHAVSLGEVVASAPLIQHLLRRGWRVMVTTMTPTGSAQVIKQFGSQVSHQYIPYDLPCVVKRFYKKLSPRLGIIMETELWPNLIVEAKRADVPLLLVNGRISDKAYPQYYRLRVFFKPILNQLTKIMTQSSLDAERFRQLGASAHRVETVGNIKFDLPFEVLEPTQAAVFKTFADRWEQRFVVIVASTHDDEEAQILSQLRHLQQSIPNVLILIAPRHPERFQLVYRLCLQQGFKTGLRSDVVSIDGAVDVIVLDSLGELSRLYVLGDLAFVGGSLVPIGGHNVLEPIAANVPVLCGPFMHNAQSVCETLLAAEALIQVQSAAELIEQIIQLQADPVRRTRQIQHATDVLKANQGTLLRYVNEVEHLLMETKNS